MWFFITICYRLRKPKSRYKSIQYPVLPEGFPTDHANYDTTPSPYTPNSYVGHPPADIKDNNIFRLYYTNPNGFTYNTTQENDFTKHCNEIYRIDTDLFCAVEINLDTTKHVVTQHIHSTTTQIFDHYRLAYGSTTVPSANTYKPGGILALIQGPTSGRVITSGSDSLGCWTYFILTGRDSKKLCFITLYFPAEQPLCTQDGGLCTLTINAQQSSILCQQGRTLNPQQAFFKISNISSNPCETQATACLSSVTSINHWTLATPN